MSHSWYACDKENRTCFELGKNCPSETEELIQMVIEGAIFDVEEFNLIGSHLKDFSIFDRDKREALYYYLSSIKPENFELVFHEDHLSETVFDCLNDNRPVNQVNSLYNNCSTWTFNKFILSNK